MSMLETDRQTDRERDRQRDCIHDSSMQKTDTAGAMQHDKRIVEAVIYLSIKQKKKKKR